jgi:hypothetical protein
MAYSRLSSLLRGRVFACVRARACVCVYVYVCVCVKMSSHRQ